jgi:hypothetical protein
LAQPHRLTLALISLAVVASGCRLFTEHAPCEQGRYECASGEICGDDGFCRALEPTDDAGGTPLDDAGNPLTDGGPPPVDGGSPADSGAPPVDAGLDGGQPIDSGTPPGDAGVDGGGPPDDAGQPADDAGPNDGGAPFDGGPVVDAGDAGPDCGNGMREGDEECDQGMLNSDTIPNRCRTDCTAPGCGDDVIDDGEVCDGLAVREACASYGLLAGDGGVACINQCQAVDETGCVGGAVDSLDAIEAAIAEAFGVPGRTLVLIEPGAYTLDRTIVINEQDGDNDGIVIAPVGNGDVRFDSGDAGYTGPAFDVQSNGVRFRYLTFEELESAIDSAGNNTEVRNNHFINSGVIPTNVVRTRSQRAIIEGNRLENTTGVLGGRAIHVSDEEETEITGNVITGSYRESIFVNGQNTNSVPLFIDHNSLALDPTLASTGISISSASGVCLRNNAVVGGGSTTGVELNNMSLGNNGRCLGVTSRQNAVFGHGTLCTGNDCDLCDTVNFDFCDVADDPSFANADLCLATTSPVRDVGVDVGFDQLPTNGSATFDGAAHAIGARDTDSTWVYGSKTVVCPAP